MLLNDAKSSYGMYSRAGRNTVEKFHLLMRKDEILSGNQKKVYIKGNFTTDEYIKSNDEDEDIDIFAVEKKLKSNKEIKKLDDFQERGSRSKYMEKIKQKQEIFLVSGKMDNPNCTKYNPKYDYIWKRCLTGPTWDKSERRNYSAKDNKFISPDFYLSHTELNVKGKNMIDLARMTHREINKPKIMLNNTKEITKDQMNTIETDNYQALTTSSNTDGKQSIYNPLITDESRKTTAGIPKKKEKKDIKRKYNKIQAPDFKKTISRDQLDRIYGDKETVIPFSLPNYKLTRSRPIVLVQYNRMLVRKPENKREIHEAALDYDPDKIIENINNHQKPKTPNFNSMTSRPTDSGPLPFYMKKIYNKQSTFLMTEDSLKMNNFSNAKFPNPSSCFWPKKSFNKFINLNLMNSTKFKDHLGIKYDIKNTEVDDYIQKSMKFYNKNFDELIKESMLNKFDNVTYKTLKKVSKLENGELEKFFVSFDNGDC